MRNDTFTKNLQKKFHTMTCANSIKSETNSVCDWSISCSRHFVNFFYKFYVNLVFL